MIIHTRRMNSEPITVIIGNGRYLGSRFNILACGFSATRDQNKRISEADMFDDKLFELTNESPINLIWYQQRATERNKYSFFFWMPHKNYFKNVIRRSNGITVASLSVRFFTSTVSASKERLLTITRYGIPMRSLSANLTPARSSRSS